MTAVWGFVLTVASWRLFAALILAPDLVMLGYVMLGYLAGPRVGAASYDAAHTYAAPVALVWAAHVGLDRALGYGLKLTDGFRYTHLGRIGRADA